MDQSREGRGEYTYRGDQSREGSENIPAGVGVHLAGSRAHFAAVAHAPEEVRTAAGGGADVKDGHGRLRDLQHRLPGAVTVTVTVTVTVIVTVTRERWPWTPP
eukprot:712132-Prorocentrum_minimum.AAC.1